MEKVAGLYRRAWRDRYSERGGLLGYQAGKFLLHPFGEEESARHARLVCPLIELFLAFLSVAGSADRNHVSEGIFPAAGQRANVIGLWPAGAPQYMHEPLSLMARSSVRVKDDPPDLILAWRACHFSRSRDRRSSEGSARYRQVSHTFDHARCREPHTLQGRPVSGVEVDSMGLAARLEVVTGGRGAERHHQSLHHREATDSDSRNCYSGRNA